jgi:hypothetical protein
MNLIKYEQQTEGQVAQLSAFVHFGKKIESSGLHNGWYITFNLTGINKFKSDYMCPQVFEIVPQPCFLRYAIATRKSHNHRIVYSARVWCPTKLLTGK